jgi:hypothetical protein
MNFSPSSCYFSPLRSKTQFSNTITVHSFLHVMDQASHTYVNKRRGYNFVYVRLSVLDSKWEGKSSGLNGSRNSSDLIYLNFFGHSNVIC